MPLSAHGSAFGLPGPLRAREPAAAAIPAQVVAARVSGLSAARLAATPGDGLGPNDALPRPSWWHGPCDGGPGGAYPGSKPNGASFDGLVSCGPGPHQGGQDHLVQFFPGAFGEYEWECVELSMRFMLEAWGVPPYPANGNEVVSDYPEGAAGYPRLQQIANGTPGRSPQPGDVLSIADADPFGHTEVVASSSVDPGGDGSLRAITENWSKKMSGWVSLTVTDWVVSDGVPGDRVLGWLHNPSWSLELPLVWRLSTSGTLSVKDSGHLDGPWRQIASGIEAAEMAGGGGYGPDGLVAALAPSGALEAGPVLPGVPLETVTTAAATGPSTFAISSGTGPKGRPLLAFVTDSGALDLLGGSFAGEPRVLVSSGVREVTLAAGSGPGEGAIGILTDGGTFEVAEGDLESPLSWQAVARGASQIALAGAGDGPTQVVEAYLEGGRFFERQGSSGAFAMLGAGVRQMSVATVGPEGVPLLAAVTSLGGLDVAYGSGPLVEVATGVAQVSVTGGPTPMGFPIVAFATAAHKMLVFEGIPGRARNEAAGGVLAMGAAALTVS